MRNFKTNLVWAFMVLAFVLVSCDNDDSTNTDPNTGINSGSINEREIEYLVAAAEVLRNDCLTLWVSWEGGKGEEALMEELELEVSAPYAEEYKNAGQAGSRYLTQLDAVDEMVQGIVGIADELGVVKIGSANGGSDASAPEEAESRFSHNSLTDFKNNMLSIQNVYLGGYDAATRGNGLTVFVAEKDATLDADVKVKITAAIAALEACPEPFVENLKDAKVETAIAAIAEVEAIFSGEITTLVQNGGDYDFSTILNDYVDYTIIPTYKAMFDNAQLLLAASETFSSAPTSANLATASTAWKATRAPWENSESFLFGPAGDKNLDPLLDSWPVDETQLTNVINSNQELSASFVADGLGYVMRGFHTVEYLIFREGEVREVE